MIPFSRDLVEKGRMLPGSHYGTGKPKASAKNRQRQKVRLLQRLG
jgi:hypothetical protein